MKSTAAFCAKAVKAELKAYYPNVKFRVTSENYSGGNSVNVSWTDGPICKDVESLLSKYEYGSFDGMIDLYTNDNLRDDIPQTKYLFCNRSVSPSIVEETRGKLASYMGDWDSLGSYEQERRLYQAINEMGAL